MATPEERLDEAATMAEAATAIATDWANGPVRDVIPEPISGPMPTIKKFLSLKSAEIDSNASNIAAFKASLGAATSTDLVGGSEAGKITNKLNQLLIPSVDHFTRGIGIDDHVVIIGDSLTESVGASSYYNGYAEQVVRSICNHMDLGYGQSRGYGYGINHNMTRFLSEQGISTTGFVNSGGRLILQEGTSLTVTLREIAFADLIYDGSQSTGSVNIKVGGVTIRTVTGLNTGAISTTFPTRLFPVGDEAFNIDLDQVVTFEVTTGSAITVLGFIGFKSTAKSCPVQVFSESGSAYQEWTVAGRINEVCQQVNIFNKSRKIFILALGTNSIYNPLKAQTPSVMVGFIQAYINAIKLQCAGSEFIVSVPPRANSPIITGNTYEEYVDAITDFCTANNYTAWRLDQSPISTHGNPYLPDNIHPNDAGHHIIAADLCSVLGVPLQTYIKTDLYDDPSFILHRLIKINLTDFTVSGDTAFFDVPIPSSRLNEILIKNEPAGVVTNISQTQQGASGLYWVFTGTNTRFFYSIANGVGPLSGGVSTWFSPTTPASDLILIVQYKG